MCYGIEILSHYFNANRIPEFSSTCDFLRKHLPDIFADVPNDRTPVHVFFHCYCDMKRLGPTMYNHFTTLIPIPHLSQADQTLNTEVELEVKPWWTKVDNVNGYDCSLKEVKAQKGKGKLSKIERKKLNEALTFHYLKNCDDGVKVNMEMAKRLEEAQQKEAALAAELNIDVLLHYGYSPRN